jgi:YYY domain-containing protein
MEWLAVAVWGLGATVAFIIGRPLAGALCGDDRWLRAGLAIPLTLVSVGVGAYLVGMGSFGRPTAWVAASLPVALAGALTWWRGYPRPGRADRTVAIVFVLAAMLMLMIRGLDPAIVAIGGEKFLDYGLLRSLLRTEMLPPADPWFAGEAVRYYYGGQLVVATLTLLADTDPAVAYNLGIILTYATVVATAAAIGASLSGRPIIGATGSALAVGVASNPMPAVRLVLGILPDPLQHAMITPIAAATQYDAALLGAGPEGFFYWWASRVIPGTITEFPLFAFRNGDLHAHMLGMPAVLAATGLAVALLRTEPTQRSRRWAIVGVMGVLAGWQAVQNTWDVPIIIGLVGLASVLISVQETALGVPQLRRTVGMTLTALAIALVVAWPFLHAGVVGGPDRSIALVPPPMRTSLVAMLGVYGGFMLLVTTAVVRSPRSRRAWAQIAVMAGGVGVLAAVGWASLAIPAGVVVAAVAWWRQHPARHGVTLVLVAAGTLMAVPEVVYLQELAAPGRFNTAFKIGAQVWLLLGVATGPLLAVILRRPHPRVVAAIVVVVGVSMLVYAPLTVGGVVSDAGPMTLDGTAYLADSAPQIAPAVAWLAQQPGQPTIVEAPGTRWYPTGTDGRDRVPYSIQSNPAASLTGLPTVAGWSHEVGYRGVEPYRMRVRAVDTIYTGTPQERARLLERYDVRYIWVGPAERARYGERMTIAEDRPSHYAGGEVVIYAGVSGPPER